MLARALLFSVLLTLPTAAAAQPGISKAEATALYGAAGFPIVEDRPVNRCGVPATPRTTFVDLNGDGSREVLFIDFNPDCYGAPGGYFAVLTRTGGVWRAVISDTGSIQAQPGKTMGWFDMIVSQGTCNGTFRFDGTRYASVQGCGAQEAAGPSTQQPMAAAAGAGPTGAWKLPMAFTQIPAAERDAIFRAAGFEKRGEKWTACDGNSEVFTDDEWIAGGAVRDLNGDGLPEVIVGDGGTFCHGMTGQGYAILTPTSGGWRVIESGTGIPSFLETRGADGWPDIEVGVPGFCFPVLRWTGSEYALHRQHYEGRPCTRD